MCRNTSNEATNTVKMASIGFRGPLDGKGTFCGPILSHLGTLCGPIYENLGMQICFLDTYHFRHTNMT